MNCCGVWGFGCLWVTFSIAKVTEWFVVKQVDFFSSTKTPNPSKFLKLMHSLKILYIQLDCFSRTEFVFSSTFIFFSSLAIFFEPLLSCLPAEIRSIIKCQVIKAKGQGWWCGQSSPVFFGFFLNKYIKASIIWTIPFENNRSIAAQLIFKNVCYIHSAMFWFSFLFGLFFSLSPPLLSM